MTRDIIAEFKALRLHGMASTWVDLIEQNNGEIDGLRWLIEKMLSAETTDRATRSVTHQMNAAKFPVHRDLAGFDFEVSPVDRKLVTQLAGTAFSEAAHNVVFVGGPGSGKSHLAIAIGVSAIAQHDKRVRFYSTVDLVNALEQEKAQGKAGRIAASMLRMDIVILDLCAGHSDVKWHARTGVDPHRLPFSLNITSRTVDASSTMECTHAQGHLPQRSRPVRAVSLCGRA